MAVVSDGGHRHSADHHRRIQAAWQDNKYDRSIAQDKPEHRAPSPVGAN